VQENPTTVEPVGVIDPLIFAFCTYTAPTLWARTVDGRNMIPRMKPDRTATQILTRFIFGVLLLGVIYPERREA
jgi:hypothetical protein